jgi:hypothetical protein
MDPGHVYLIKMADCVYKVGRSEAIMKRMGQYPRDSTIIYIRKCSSVAETERLIIASFRTNFTCHSRGTEYFTGCESDMICTINSIVDCNYTFTQPLTIENSKLPRSPLQVEAIERARAKKAETDTIRIREKNQKKLENLLSQVRETFRIVFPDKEIIFQSEQDD